MPAYNEALFDRIYSTRMSDMSINPCDTFASEQDFDFIGLVIRLIALFK